MPTAVGTSAPLDRGHALTIFSEVLQAKNRIFREFEGAGQNELDINGIRVKRLLNEKGEGFQATFHLYGQMHTITVMGKEY